VKKARVQIEAAAVGINIMMINSSATHQLEHNSGKKN
jgi:hypothetical protein